ncbi:MraY family glycosyltransferase [Nocardioides sambongensis]|uniref:MraY family glycosyltransferase n=1 Tax=Nocardioides sambongensis TaxID=2589074 RepID=UPI00112E932A|nr:glycosyltransferase family 4 protein [Nocardioides sambongensis]
MVPFLLSFVLCLALVGILIPVLRRAQFMDVPNHRSSHSASVPRGGGFSVILTLALMLLVFGRDGDGWGVVLAAMLVMTGVGLVDDLRSLGSGIRLTLQLAAGVALAVWAVHAGVSLWWAPALVIGVAGYINAFNFMDGVNGISGLTGAVVGGWWWAVGAAHDLGLVTVLGAALLGASLGFLPWNAPRAKVFLGDVGSYGIGLVVVALSVVAWVGGVDRWMAAAPLVVYCADTGWVLLKRVRGGRSLTEAHREHAYQRLTDAGWPHLASAGFCAAAGAAVCAASLLAEESLGLAVALGAAAVAAYLAAPSVLVRKRVQA